MSEAAPTMPNPERVDQQWRKSSRSDPNGACVEVAACGEWVRVRDSKAPHSATLGFPLAEWRRFLSEARAGSFDARIAAA